MAVRDREFLMSVIKEHIGEKADQESITLLEDFTDTVDYMEKASKPGGEDWKAKYEELDKEWAARYKERFFSGGPEPETADPSNVTTTPEPAPDKPISFESLFSTEEKKNG